MRIALSVQRNFLHHFTFSRLRASVFASLSFLCAGMAISQNPTPLPADPASAVGPGMPAPIADNRIFAHVLFDQFEGRTSGSNSRFRWDGEAWVGTDMNKLWLKSEGFANRSAVSDGDQEALYDRPLPHTRYLDGQVGVRADLDSGRVRTWAAVGVEGLLPYYFQFAPTFYIRDGGNVAGRLTGSYDLLLTQRLILQPEAEMNFYNKDDPGRRTGSGLSDLDTGLRLRYEITRKFAPYVGFAYDGKYGGTARYSRLAGESMNDPRLIFGLRLWY